MKTASGTRDGVIPVGVNPDAERFRLSNIPWFENEIEPVLVGADIFQWIIKLDILALLKPSCSYAISYGDTFPPPPLRTDSRAALLYIN